jgi:formylglycine-generating enzyme required for sulfatase activity
VEVNGKFMVPYTTTIPGTTIEFTMVPVAGGTFKMGSPDSEQGRDGDEGPQRQIQVDPFWIAKTELTWAEYKTFMGVYSLFKRGKTLGLEPVTASNKPDAITAPTPLYEPSHTYEYGDDLRQPAVTMTQYAAKQYTKWLSGMSGTQYRIPSEAEWEYAARAGSTTAYSFGDDATELGTYAAYADNAPDGPAKVGSFKPNAWGLFDMHGNVWEWVIDGHLKAYPESTGTANWKDAIVWPTEASGRVVRGGGFQDPPERLRSAVRMASDDSSWKDSDPNIPLSPWWYTDDPARAVGMRLVRSATPLDKELIGKFWNIDNADIQDDVDIRLEEGRGVLGLPVPSLADKLKPR